MAARGKCHFEIVDDSLRPRNVRHVLFDFDGTISLIREGWQNIMAPMMIRAICPNREPPPEVVRRVHEYIEKSTGIQTILQMEELVRMVREFGFVPEDQILDAAGYKRIYNEELMKPVRERLEKLRRGELTVRDLTLAGAIEFLEELYRRGVTLYVASGTDREDVVNEAKALGVDRFFGERIYGAIGRFEDYNKDMVIKQIIREHGLSGPEFVVIGDGPVEIRNARENGAVAIGVASDEKRGRGLNEKKRKRLIDAGAHVIVADFTCRERILEYLFGG